MVNLRKIMGIPLVFGFGIATLASCSQEEPARSSAPSTPAAASQSGDDSNQWMLNQGPRKPTPTPQKPSLKTFNVGDTITLPSATFTVKTIEQREEIPSSSPQYIPDFVAPEGKRLWYFDIDWTNTTNDAIMSECHGPYKFNLTAYDINGVQMLEVEQPGMIEGQNCSSGLLKGESGNWKTAFTSLDADFGWAIFEDYGGGRAIVVKDPSLDLVEIKE
ncbi:hypothetical protein [Actinotignum schaalii]|nr:hypothetical protein [Actinotignum schaalii]